jgi:hypothetical protein
MERIWVQKTLENRFLQALISTSRQTNPPSGYEDEIKSILRENIFDCNGVIGERKGSVTGSQGTVDKIDLIVSTQSYRECIQVKMYQFVRKVPPEIIEDFMKLNKIPTNFKRTFIYFGFYGRYQNPATNAKFSTLGRINEIAEQCNSMNDELLKIIGQQTPLDDCAAIVHSTQNSHIYYAYWMTF